MKHDIPADWQDWIKLNLGRGCDKDGIARILFDNGFHPLAIVAAMQYLPQSAELVAAMNAQLQALPPATAEPVSSALQAIDAVYLPRARRLETDKAHLYLLEDFLTPGECAELVQRIRRDCQASTITNPDEPDKYFRTSKTSNLPGHGDPVVADIDRRIADYMGFEPERGECMQGQYYQVGEEFKPHTDYFEPGTAEYDRYAGSMGQRTWTFMIYLNDVPRGGETEFTRLGLAVTPKQGMAVIWNSLRADGSVNPDTLHWARPVAIGEKFVITKWFRTQGSLRQPYRPAEWRKIPAFTREGFRKSRVPEPLIAAIAAFYAERRAASAPETSDAIGTFIRTVDASAPSRMIELDDTLRAQISAAMHPLLEAWAGRKLRMTAVYGIREYQRGAMLDMHIDRKETHIVSAIMNVAQEVASDWPLVIHDHVERRHGVLLKPGEMLFYESARLRHGRPQPLDGAYFANVFVHAMPA